MGPFGGITGDVERRLDAEVAHAGDEDAALDAGLLACVVDPARDAVDVLLVREAHEPRVVGRGGELHVDRALARASGEVLVGDVAVVLAVRMTLAALS
jgi:hypothetical protein